MAFYRTTPSEQRNGNTAFAEANEENQGAEEPKTNYRYCGTPLVTLAPPGLAGTIMFVPGAAFVTGADAGGAGVATPG